MFTISHMAAYANNEANRSLLSDAARVPGTLFDGDVQGAWFDPSDLSTMYQDEAGTVPVTTAGDPVGRIEDKSGNGNHATQSTDASRPVLQKANGLWYLGFDGVDDRLSTGNIDFTTSDKITILMALHKTSDAATASVSELSALGAVNGSIEVRAPNGNGSDNYRFGSKGTAVSYITAAGFAAPVTNVITCVGGIAADVALLRVDGVQEASGATDQGTGTFGDHALHIGARLNDTIPFNGNVYGYIIVGALLSDTQTDNTEAYLASKADRYFGLSTNVFTGAFAPAFA